MLIELEISTYDPAVSSNPGESHVYKSLYTPFGKLSFGILAVNMYLVVEVLSGEVCKA
jgi:hypothetical protein